jgi:hypothetical protein
MDDFYSNIPSWGLNRIVMSVLSCGIYGQGGRGGPIFELFYQMLLVRSGSIDLFVYQCFLVSSKIWMCPHEQLCIFGYFFDS